MTDKYYKQAIDRLVKSSEKEEKESSKTFYKLLITFLRETNMYEELKPRNNTFILKRDFYQKFTDSDLYKAATVSEVMMSRFFKALRETEVIGAKSESFTTEHEASRVNKYLPFLSDENFYLVDMVDDFEQQMFSELNEANDVEEALFLLLYIFAPDDWKKIHFLQAEYKNIIHTDEKSFIVFDDREFEDEEAEIKYGYVPLQVKPLPHQVATFLQDTTLRSSNGKIFEKSFDTLRKGARKRIIAFFDKFIAKHLFRKALVFNSITDIGPFRTAHAFKKIKFIALSVLELDYLYPGSVPSHLVEIEQNNLTIVRDSKINLDEYEFDVREEGDFDYDEDIAPLYKFKYEKKKYDLMSFNNVTIKPKYIKIVLEQLVAKYETTQDQSLVMILKYVIHLFQRVLNQEEGYIQISFKTATGYIGSLRKHLFNNYTDLENLEWSQLALYLSFLRDSRHTGLENGVVAYVQTEELIKRFLAFSNKETGSLYVIAHHMQRSLVFREEVDLILEEIDKKYTALPIKRASQNIPFFKLQDQVFILLLYYAGLRKNELRTRRLQDIYEDTINLYDISISENCFTIDVNEEAMKSDKTVKKLKTKNAKRKVTFYVNNPLHADMVKRFIKQSQKQKGTSLFKNRKFSVTTNAKSIDREILGGILEEKHLDYLNDIIKDVTKRPCSLHTLRHSYVTNSIGYISEHFSFNTALMSLSVEIGHASIGTSFLNYGHLDLMILKRYKNG